MYINIYSKRVIRYARSWNDVLKHGSQNQNLKNCKSATMEWLSVNCSFFSACFWPGEISQRFDWALMQLLESAELRVPVDLVIWHFVCAAQVGSPHPWGSYPLWGSPGLLFTTPADKKCCCTLFSRRGLLLVLSHAECAWEIWIKYTCQHAWKHCVDT